VPPCNLDEVGEAYIALGENLAGFREEPSGTEPPLVQAFILECGDEAFNISVGELVGKEAREAMIESMSQRGLIPICRPLSPADSLAHALIFAGLLAAAEARGDPTASTVRLRLIDEVLAPAARKLRSMEYCSSLLAEAIESIIEEDLECLGVLDKKAARKESAA
jgi:hypothetical protein